MIIPRCFAADAPDEDDSLFGKFRTLGSKMSALIDDGPDESGGVPAEARSKPADCKMEVCHALLTSPVGLLRVTRRCVDYGGMGSFGDPGTLQLDAADVKAALSPAAKYLSGKSSELMGKAEERGFSISTSVYALPPFADLAVALCMFA